MVKPQPSLTILKKPSPFQLQYFLLKYLVAWNWLKLARFGPYRYKHATSIFAILIFPRQGRIVYGNLSGHEAILSLQFDQLSLTHLTFTRCISTMPKHSWLWNGYKLCVLTLIQNPLTLCTIYWYNRYSDLIYHKFSCPANKKIFDLIIRNKNQNGINSTSFIENLSPCYLPCKIFIFKLPY